ncbi:MAG: MFS transporter [Pseudonocardiaceae bacterium]
MWSAAWPISSTRGCPGDRRHFLADFGASALVVGFITGVGEAVALVLRLGTGQLADRTGRHWALSITGYVVTVVAVPLLALTQTLWQAAVLVVAERFGKAVRTPARDTMLAQASGKTGRGRAFALHEALDHGLAWLGGATIPGALYDYSIPALITFAIVTQALALLLFVPLLRHR